MFLRQLNFGVFLVCHRSSLPEIFCKKGVLRNCGKFPGKHLCQSIFFNKVAGLRPATLLIKRLCHRRFPVSFMKFLRTPFLQNTTGRLLPAVLFNMSSECLLNKKGEWWCHLLFLMTSVKMFSGLSHDQSDDFINHLLLGKYIIGTSSKFVPWNSRF